MNNEENLPGEVEKLASLQEEITRLYERGLMSQRTYQRRLAAIKQKLADLEQQTQQSPLQADGGT